MSQLPSMPLYVDDFEADTAHLTLEEDGVYNRLLRLCWRTPGCSVPDDPAWIARRLRCDAATYERVVAPIIEEFFTRSSTASGKRIFQKRQREEFQYVTDVVAKRKAAGSKGGAAKSRKAKDFNASKATREPEANDVANASTTLAPTPTPTPTFKEAEEEARARDPDPPSGLFDRVLVAAGLNPNDLPSAYWMPPAAEVEVNGWRSLGLTDDQIVDCVAQRQRRSTGKPDGPRAFLGDLRRLAGALSAAPPTAIAATAGVNGTGPPRMSQAAFDEAMRLGFGGGSNEHQG